MSAPLPGKNIVIVSGPAGSGKDTLLQRLAKQVHIEPVISTTTRAPRPEEKEGRPYYFVGTPTFEKMITEGRFIEYSINENQQYYGITYEEIARFEHGNTIGVWKPDWKGVMAAKKLFPKVPTIYIAVPRASLEKRLRHRDTDKNEAYFRDRMAYTDEWLRHLDIYDYTIANDDGKIEETAQELLELIEEITGS
jgi:guanylate kinase